MPRGHLPHGGRMPHRAGPVLDGLPWYEPCSVETVEDTKSMLKNIAKIVAFAAVASMSTFAFADDAKQQADKAADQADKAADKADQAKDSTKDAKDKATKQTAKAKGAADTAKDSAKDATKDAAKDTAKD